MPPLAAAVAAYLTISVAMAYVVIAVAVVTLASVAYSAYMMATMETPSNKSDATNRLQTVRSSVQPHRIIYGEVMTGGALIYAQSHSINPVTLEQESGTNKYITLVVCFCAHQVEAIKEIWLNNKISTDVAFNINIAGQPEECYWQYVSEDTSEWIVTKAAVPARTDSYVHVTKYLGTLDQAADPFLISLPDEPSTVISKSAESGLDDLTISGTYTAENMAVITISISTVGATDTFTWTETKYENDGTTTYVAGSGSVAMTGANQLIADGISIRFAAVTGHSVGQSWEIRAYDGAPWTANCTLTNRCYAVVTLQYSNTIFPTGLPNIKALIQGNNQIYNPATLTTGYTNNFALCVRDYLTKPYGLNAPWADINDDYTIAGANTCDESITLADGTTQKRYTVNGSFLLDKTPTAIMNELLASAYGKLVWIQGQYRILPAAYQAPDLTFHGLNPDIPGLTESDLRGSIKVRPKSSMKDKFNTVKGTYISRETWQSIDFPKVTNALYVSEDGGEIVKDIQLNYITDAAAAQRIAKIVLEKGRQAISVDFPAKWSAFPLCPGATVPVTVAYLGWSQKVFEVIDWKMNPDGGIDLQLQEEAEACYAWNSGEESTVDLAQNTLLPDPRYVPVPTELTAGEELYMSTGNIVKCRAIVTWDKANVAQYEVNYLPPNNTIWAPLPLTTDTTCTVDDTIPGGYSFRVRCMNYLGAWGEWATTTKTLLGKTAPPATVSGLSAEITRGAMRIYWTANADLDIAGYELQLGTTWDAVGNITLISNYAGTSYPWTPDITGTISILAKAIDTSGNYSTSAARLDYTIAGPGAVTALTQNVIDNNVTLKWTAGANGSFPIDYYEISRGTDYATSTQIGRKYGTFDVIVESAARTNKYWVVAVDTAGLKSAETGVYASVNSPPDYVLYNEQNLNFAAATLTNALVENGQLIMPVNTSITWENHFISNPDTTLEPWASPQDQIDDGYTVYASPAPASGSITQVIDYGAGASINAMIRMDVTRLDVFGAVTLTPKIETSPDNSTWTDLGNVYEAMGTSFRYVRYTLTATTSNGGIQQIRQIATKLDMKLKTHQGICSAVSTDSGGTTVYITDDGTSGGDPLFIDVQAIILTPKGTAARYAIYDFNDAAYPTYFKIYLFDIAGNRLSGDVSWTVRGV